MLKESLSAKEKEITKFLLLLKAPIPPHIRHKLWLIASGALKEMNSFPHYYSSLRQLSQEIPSLYENKIQADLQRTQEIEMKKETFTALYNVLKCFSIRNTTIGYCQGFNYICNQIYSVTKDEEETFWIFCKIIEDILPINYFTELAGLITDATIIYGMIESIFPEMVQFFENNGYQISVSSFIHKWLIGLFTQNLSKNICDFIWDMFLLEGHPVLIQASLIIFYNLKSLIMSDRKNGLKNLYDVLNEQFTTITDVDMFKEFFSKDMYKFRKEQLVDIEKEILKDYLNDSHINPNDINILPIMVKNNSNIKCSLKYPYCLNTTSIAVRKGGIEFLCYTSLSLEIIEDHFSYKKEKKNIVDEKIFGILDDEGSSLNILLERREHYCKNQKENFNIIKIEETSPTTPSKKGKEKDEVCESIKKIPKVANFKKEYIKKKMPLPFFDVDSSMAE